MGVIASVRHLFTNDDGSLPDIYVLGLTSTEADELYRSIRLQTLDPGDAVTWSNSEQASIPIRELVNPAESLAKGRIALFRHLLGGFAPSGTELPELTVAMEPDHISFDHRMGAHWTDDAIEALLAFLARIKRAHPNARIVRADEGSHEYSDREFEEAVNVLAAMCRSPS